MNQNGTVGHHVAETTGLNMASHAMVETFSGTYGSTIRTPLVQGYAPPFEVQAHSGARHPRLTMNWLGRSVTLIQASRWSVGTLLADVIFAGGPAFAYLGQLSQASLAVMIWIVVAALSGVYRFRSPVAAQGYMWYVRALIVPGVFATLAMWGGDKLAASWEASVQLTMAMAGGLVALRVVTWTFVGMARRRGHGLERTLVLGDALESERLTSKLRTFPDAGLEFTRSQNVSARRRKTDGVDGTTAPMLLERHRDLDLDGIDHVLIGLSSISALADGHVLESAARVGASVSVVAPGTSIHRWTSARRIGDVPIDTLNASGPMTLRVWSKRLIDITVASFGLVLVSPVLAIAALAIRLQDKGPVFYRQERVGRHGQGFKMWKLRTMVVDADTTRAHLDEHNTASGLLFKVNSDPRVTRVGGWLRRYAIDEIPQLINVVAGDMSLVGPRPLAVQADQFDQRALGRHDLRPGMTGAWQVEGANALSYEDMIRLDLDYVTSWSLMLDMSILARTVMAVLVRRGAY